jgi:hypothetical protein
MNYDNYNREERAICAHLFRLLHEQINKNWRSPLGKFLSKIELNKHGFDFTNLKFENIGIYCEVAIIRDAYQNQKPDIFEFMDKLTKIIMQQEKITVCRLFSELPDILKNPKETHPKQIRQKAISAGVDFTESENQVYGAMQGMFNAKPDLVITIDNKLLVFEAKFTEPFDEVQMKRTENITEIWSELLFNDFGFSTQPESFIIKLGPKKFNPNISWTEIKNIAKETYGYNDRTLISLEKGVELLEKYKLE